MVRDNRNPIITCVIEPGSGHELDGDDIAGQDQEPSTVLVVGGGQAGMEAARVLAERGHRVRLLPYRFCSVKMGTVYFVIYSNRDKPLTREMLDEALKKGGKSSYTIEGGLQEYYPFPVIMENYLDRALKKLQYKRIDAIVWPQEDVDNILKQIRSATFTGNITAVLTM